jgi:hypothetical protein
MFQDLLLAEFVVADLTIDNSNVRYEIGVSLVRLAASPVARDRRSLQRAADLGEHRAHLRADGLDRDNDDKRNEARDQRIFDCCHAILVA